MYLINFFLFLKVIIGFVYLVLNFRGVLKEVFCLNFIGLLMVLSFFKVVLIFLFMRLLIEIFIVFNLLYNDYVVYKRGSKYCRVR